MELELFSVKSKRLIFLSFFGVFRLYELYRQTKVGGLEITETSYLVNGLENYLFLIMMALKTTYLFNVTSKFVG